MAISIKCPICENWFNSQNSYDSHLPCEGGSPVGASGSESIDKYAKKGTGRP